MQALSHFTLLAAGLGPGASAGANLSLAGGAAMPFSQMRQKHVEALKTLIHVAYTDGNYLGSNWFDVRFSLSLSPSFSSFMQPFQHCTGTAAMQRVGNDMFGVLRLPGTPLICLLVGMFSFFIKSGLGPYICVVIAVNTCRVYDISLGCTRMYASSVDVMNVHVDL